MGRPKKTVNTEHIQNTQEQNITEVQEIKEKRTIDLHERVRCVNATRGKLIYVSKKNNGLTIIWDNFGDEDYLEVDELISMRNSYPRFFQDGWIVIDDEDVIDFLGVRKYYDNLIDINNFDSIFHKKPDELRELLQKLPKGQKDAVGQRALELIKSEELYDSRIIKVIEQVLEIDFSIL